MLKFIDSILNRITMYRLVLYYLITILFAAFVFGFFGIMPNNPIDLAFSTFVIVLVSWITNWIFAKVFNVQTNVESVYITALILALIITPVTVTDQLGIGFLIFVSVWAMASKYIFAVGKKHIFNPAAFAVALTALTLNHPATWWVGGNLALLLFVFVGGLLIVRKVRRFDMVLSFSIIALLTVAITSTDSYSISIIQTVLRSSFLFFAFVMLTEPLTTPPTMLLRVFYGAIVGFLFAPAIHIGSFYMTPEVGLLIGNVFSYIVSPKGRYTLTLERIEKSAKDVYNFIFTPDRNFTFRPGQYLEWTLGHRHADSRGNRRYFTIASSPTESSVQLGVKFYKPPSTFKRKLALMKEGDSISASHLSGNFILPKDPNKKLVFIAGGIGVTPFRSMVKYLLDKKEKRTVVMFYANKTLKDIAYKDMFDRAQTELGIKIIYVLSDEKGFLPARMTGGLIDAQLIAREVPDYRDYTFYISGPHAMVEAFKKILITVGVSRFKIKSDFFPGFV